MWKYKAKFEELVPKIGTSSSGGPECMWKPSLHIYVPLRVGDVLIWISL